MRWAKSWQTPARAFQMAASGVQLSVAPLVYLNSLWMARFNPSRASRSGKSERSRRRAQVFASVPDVTATEARV